MHAPILITNDDGIESPGLWAIAAELAAFENVWIVAPRNQYTGAGRCFFPENDGVCAAYEPPIATACEVKAFSLGGSPAQCVYQAIEEILPKKPALVVSGINYGENLGNIITGSGTIGAAIEAASLGASALAISLEILPEFGYRNHSTDVDFSAAAHFGRYFAEKILTNGLPKGVDILKVDVPRGATTDTEWRMTTISRSSGMGRRIERGNERAKIIWFPETNLNSVEADSDIQAVLSDKVVSVSPMTIDMTAKNLLAEVAAYLR